MADLTSIVIVAHNQLELTKACIASIRASTPEPHELIVVDNGSTDGTRAYLEREKKRGLRVIRNGLNLGYAAGNNQGIRIARGDRLVLLNNDTVVTCGWLGRLIAAGESDSKIGLVGPITNRASGVQQRGDGHYCTPPGLEIWARYIARANAGKALIIDPNSERLVGFCLMVKPEALAKLSYPDGKLLDEAYRGAFEDDDLCLRARLAGFDLTVAADCWVHHAGSKTIEALGLKQAQLIAENRAVFERKWQGLLPLGWVRGAA